MIVLHLFSPGARKLTLTLNSHLLLAHGVFSTRKQTKGKLQPAQITAVSTFNFPWSGVKTRESKLWQKAQTICSWCFSLCSLAAKICNFAEWQVAKTLLNKQASCASVWLAFNSPGLLVIGQCELKWTEKKNATKFEPKKTAKQRWWSHF